MAEILFYHLERQPLEKALPGLLQRSLDRGWRVVVKVGSEERLEALNAHLWSFDDASFLPHGAASDGHAEAQPVWLTTGDDNPNSATVRFLVDGAEASDLDGYQRSVFMFDAVDQEGVAKARAAWKAAAAAHDATYWKQDENGRWTKQASA
jgi:DNA polymerase-3 subunit chi